MSKYIYSYCPICGGRASRIKRGSKTYLRCIETTCKVITTVHVVRTAKISSGVELVARIRKHEKIPAKRTKKS